MTSRRTQLESRRGRRWPKRLSKHLHAMTFIDWPYAGPAFGRPLKKFVKIARLREERLAWQTERENG